MKKIYVLAFAAMASVSAFAQNKVLKQPATQVAMPQNQKIMTGFEGIDETKPEVPPSNSAFARGLSKSVGFTNYDLQSNGTMKPRIVNLGGGKVSAAWTFGTGDLAAGVADRGTGYNTNAGGAFSAAPKKRLETVRTGFTNLVVDDKNNEYTFSHLGAGKIVMTKRTAGATTVTESQLPSTPAILWPTAAASGQTLHVAAITIPTASAGGVKYKNVDGCLLYYRSTDGGATWDKKDVILPDLDSTTYVGMSADNYDIVAKGNTVAVAYFGDWQDSRVWISQDNGNTFTSKMMNKFPLNLYKTDAGYDLTLFPATPGKAAGAITTTDGVGSLFIDKNGKVHAIVGQMNVIDSDLADGGTSYYPLTNGFFHWDETYKKDSLQYVEAWADNIKDDSITLGTGTIGTYFQSATCWPSTAVDPATGNIYVVYSAPDEKRENGDGNLYRSIFIIHSKDNGKTWSAPYDIIDNKKYYDPKDLELALAECTFPSVAEKIDNGKLHIIYQIDDSQRLHVQGTAASPVDVSDNFIYYTDVDIADVLVKTQEVVPATDVKFTVSPNPARDNMNVSYELKNAANVRLTLTDLTGRTVQSVALGTQAAGKNNYNLNLDAAPGFYFLQLNINGQIATQKVVIK